MLVAFAQGVAFPVMVPAAVGVVFSVIVFELAVPFPHPLAGVTCTVPPTAPKATVIALVLVPEVMEAPVGSVQL